MGHPIHCRSFLGPGIGAVRIFIFSDPPLPVNLETRSNLLSDLRQSGYAECADTVYRRGARFDAGRRVAPDTIIRRRTAIGASLRCSAADMQHTGLTRFRLHERLEIRLAFDDIPQCSKRLLYALLGRFLPKLRPLFAAAFFLAPARTCIARSPSVSSTPPLSSAAPVSGRARIARSRRKQTGR